MLHSPTFLQISFKRGHELYSCYEHVPAAVMFTVKMEDRQYMYVASDGGRLEVHTYR